MRLHRFYIEQPLGEELVVVEIELVHQWISVFRYGTEDEVILFSSVNAGVDYIYRIKSANKKEVVLSFVSQQKNILPKQDITLYMALVKKDTFENVVRYATELGVVEIVPILADRSEKKNLNMGRLRSITKEAAEQSGRGDMPTVSDIRSFKEAFDTDNVNILTSLNGTIGSNTIKNSHGDRKLALWIGPEGGWTEEEETFARDNNAQLMKLTETVLRADTAAIAALSTLFIS